MWVASIGAIVKPSVKSFSKIFIFERKETIMKKIVAWLLVCLMIVSSLPIAALAEALEDNMCPGFGEDHTKANCDYKQLTYIADCEVGGYIGYECNICGTTFTEYVAPKGANEHAWAKVADAVAANCQTEATGLTQKDACSDCGKTRGGEVVEPHEWLDPVEFGVDGDVYYSEKSCELCGKTIVAGDKDAASLQHNWSTTPVLVKLPTCAEQGKARYDCTEEGCDEYKIVTIEKVDCDKEALVFVSAVAATCTTAGNVAYYNCETCGANWNLTKTEKLADADVVVEALNHDAKKAHSGHYVAVNGCDLRVHEDDTYCVYDWVLTEEDHVGTCGKFERVCDLCGETLTVDLNHNFEGNDLVIVDDATCTEPGEGTRKCNYCGKDVEEVIEAKGHTYALEYVAPTCLTAGKAWLTCSVEGCEFEAASAIEGKADINADGELTDADKIDGAYLTCDAEGVIPALGHTAYANGTETKKCVAEGGYRIWNCARCATELIEDIAATGHDIKTIEVAGCCNGKAYTIKYCANPWCDVYSAEVQTSYVADGVTYDLTKTYTGANILDGTGIARLISVTIGDVVAHAATGTAFDWDAYVAATDKAAYLKQLYWFAANQTGVKAITVVDPTCEDAGKCTFVCELCDEYYEYTIAALGHDMTADAVITQIVTGTGDEATVNATNHKSTVTCTRCDHFEAQDVAHTFGTAVNVNVCSKFTVEGVELPAGKYSYEVCSGCKYVKYDAESVEDFEDADLYDTLDAADAAHGTLTLKAGQTVLCTDEKTLVYVCAECEEEVSVKKLAGTHTYRDGETVITAANAVCEKEYTCVDCGFKAVLKNHDFTGAKVLFTAPTCTAAGNIPYTACGNDGCDYVECRDADGKKIVTNDEAAYVLAELAHEVVVLDKNETATCELFAYTHKGCVNCSEGEIITDFVLGEHENAAGEKFSSKCDAEMNDITDTNCVICENELLADHVFGLPTVVGTTCYDAGYTLEECLICDFEKKTVDEDATACDHNYGGWVTDTDGVEKQFCEWYDGTNCTAVRTAKIEYQISAANKNGGETYAQGSIIAVTLKVKSNGAAFAANYVTINYDPAKVTFVGWDNLSADFNGLSAYGNAATGEMKYVSAAANATADVTVDGEQDLAVFYFRVTEGLDENMLGFTAGSTSFSIDAANTFASDCNAESELASFGMAAAHGETVTVEWDKFLDLSEDGIVDINDVVLTFAAVESREYDARIDVNKDGYITVEDAQLIADAITGKMSVYDIFTNGIPAVELA